MVDIDAWKEIKDYCDGRGATLVAVSKTKPAAALQELYAAGQRHFGENYVQELADKQAQLPQDICWHFIGHLQRNKVKQLAPYVQLIHGVDSYRLLQEINKEAQRAGRTIDVLLQVYIATEETKYGLDTAELATLLLQVKADEATLQNIRICGLMGMATNTAGEGQVKREFARLKELHTRLAATAFAGKPWFSICSMGMSADYRLAIDTGSNMVRIGSLLFGSRQPAPGV